ncbi:hypothetical protein MKY20_20000 [Cytobacillus sp. FSL W8-0315]|uniref:hypothetical protein n=1 Tax=Cytobacillus sp. FSL W8-0315 TaxID=2921600 RepID=UPI0030F737D7
MSWIVENREWIFSGIGVSVFGILGYLIKRKTNKDKTSQTITSGDNSHNIQGGNDVTVTIGDKK